MMKLEGTRRVLLLRGVVFVEPSRHPSDGSAANLLQALDLELAALGFAMTARLRGAIARVSAEQLGPLGNWMRDTLAMSLGAGVAHVPLFRAFPDGVPADTGELWWRKFLVHWLQAEDQACLFCRRTGTTHVLSPCAHVVCDHCFDGANQSACPICGHHVDAPSPFFLPTAARALPTERVRFKLIDAADSIEDAARALFTSFCARPQAMSPADVEALRALVNDFGMRVLPWLPPVIVVKENVAHIFGALNKHYDVPDSSLSKGSASSLVIRFKLAAKSS